MRSCTGAGRPSAFRLIRMSSFAVVACVLDTAADSSCATCAVAASPPEEQAGATNSRNASPVAVASRVVVPMPFVLLEGPWHAEPQDRRCHTRYRQARSGASASDQAADCDEICD